MPQPFLSLILCHRNKKEKTVVLQLSLSLAPPVWLEQTTFPVRNIVAASRLPPPAAPCFFLRLGPLLPPPGAGPQPPVNSPSSQLFLTKKRQPLLLLSLSLAPPVWLEQTTFPVRNIVAASRLPPPAAPCFFLRLGTLLPPPGAGPQPPVNSRPLNFFLRKRDSRFCCCLFLWLPLSGSNRRPCG